MSILRKVLEKFKSRLNYREQDKTALDISRSLAAGDLGNDKNYAEWAAITDDPLVIVNYVKTYITTQVSKLSGAPFRPESQNLMDMGISKRFNAVFTETYEDVMSDGYAFLAVGMKANVPVLKPVDARYIMFNGDEPTLKDATDVIVFEIVPVSLDEKLSDEIRRDDCLSAYVDFDPDEERVIVSHYHKVKDGVILDIYDDDYDNPNSVPLKGLDRIPVIRFVGQRVELNDKRYHYRGLYFMLASVVKAMALAGTKINSRVASSDDDNYIVRKDAIGNENTTWKNSGLKEIDNVDQNGEDIPPVQFVPHDNEFLTAAFNLWKTVIADILGPTVASGSEAVTREEVIARNEVKDAISNTYLLKVANSIEEVYRVVQTLKLGDTSEVVIVGGYIDSVKRQKDMAQLVALHGYAKEGGMSTRGFVEQMIAISDLPTTVKQTLSDSIKQDPLKSPQVIQLQNTINGLNQTIQNQNTQIALLRLQATQRLERQKEFIDSTERTKRLEIAFKQWAEEQKQSQEARMAILQDCLEKGDYEGAIRITDEIKNESAPVITDQLINIAANAFTDENAQSVQNALNQTAMPQADPGQLGGQQNSIPFERAVPNQQAIKQSGNVTAPMPRPAVTTFNDA